MSYDSVELSDYGSHIYYLFEFTLGDFKFNYIDSVEPMVLGGITYEPCVISLTGLKSSSDVNKEGEKIVISAESTIVKSINTAPISNQLDIVVKRGHYDELETRVIYTGSVRNRALKDSTWTFDIESEFAKLARNILTSKYQRTCPFALYSAHCGVNKFAFSRELRFASIDGVTMVSPTLVNAGYYSGGFIVCPSGQKEIRTIKIHNDGNIIIRYPFYYATLQDTFRIYAGCDRTLNTCHDKFKNHINFGGQPYINFNNPFQTGIK